jgi:peptidoglycan hydrolase FlgJ
MTLGPIANLTPHHQAPDADGASVAAQRKVAQEFEAIFLRRLMGSLEKAGGMGGSKDGGAAIFGSMMVNALADNAAASGGIGLADIIFQAMMPPAAPDAKEQGAAQPNGAAAPGAASTTAKDATPPLLPALPAGS